MNLKPFKFELQAFLKSKNMFSTYSLKYFHPIRRSFTMKRPSCYFTSTIPSTTTTTTNHHLLKYFEMQKRSYNKSQQQQQQEQQPCQKKGTIFKTLTTTTFTLGFAAFSIYYYFFKLMDMKHNSNTFALAEEVSTTTNPTTTTTTTTTSEGNNDSENDRLHVYKIENNPLLEVVKRKEDLEIVLYQYAACPFCSKVRVFLDFHKIPYQIIEVDPLLKRELSFSEYKKVPVMLINGKQLNDSSFIITALNDILDDHSSMNRNDTLIGGKDAEREIKWRQWVDQKFVHTLAPNIYRNPKEAIQAFDYILSKHQFSLFQRHAIKYAGSTAMYYVAKKLKKKHGITDERKAIFDCVDEWTQSLNNEPFMGGQRPSLADLAAYGVFMSIEGLACFHDVLAHNPRVGEWFYRVKDIVGESTAIEK